VRAPKIFVRDSGLTPALVPITSFNDLPGHPAVGGSRDGFVMENIMAVAGSRVQPYFYRTAGGAEIDCILEMPGKERWGGRLKSSAVGRLPFQKGFYVGCKDVKLTKKICRLCRQRQLPH
jgi:uncharacterized protein